MIIFVLHLVVGAVLIAFAIPLILKRVPPNNLYGWRTRSTLGDERVWYPVNRITGYWLVASGVSVIAAAIGARAVRVNMVSASWLIVATIVTYLIVLAVHGNVLIRRLKREKRNG